MVPSSEPGAPPQQAAQHTAQNEDAPVFITPHGVRTVPRKPAPKPESVGKSPRSPGRVARTNAAGGALRTAIETTARECEDRRRLGVEWAGVTIERARELASTMAPDPRFGFWAALYFEAKIRMEELTAPPEELTTQETGRKQAKKSV